MFGNHCLWGRPLAWGALWAVAFPVASEAACYQLFDKKDRLVLQSTSSPIDLSKSITDEVNRLFPGHYLIVGGAGPCPEVDELNRDARTVKLPDSLNRGPVRITPDSGDTTASGTLSAGSGTSRAPAGTRPPAGYRYSDPTCHTGPRGGRYTITQSGKRNYSGC